jgi:hypothetical protein
MEPFVGHDSIVRKIWGTGDTILFIFAGAAAEFALNKAVDWLYFTGRLPADPLGRLFSTVSYARRIVFSDREGAHAAIDKIRMIHEAVEQSRGSVIPDWAYRDVLFMLIHYSMAAFELLERRLTDAEKEEVYQVFYRLGLRMGLKDLPQDYVRWLPAREQHMLQDLEQSRYTKDLFRQYRKHLGPIRYFLLRQAQAMVVPRRVNRLLQLGNGWMFRPVLVVYKGSRAVNLDWFLKSIVLPDAYKDQIRDLDLHRA